MTNNKTNKTIFSGIKPSGVATIGNYIGAIRHWHALEKDYQCLYCVVDLHAITVRQDPKELKENIYRQLALLIACGLSPVDNIIYIQSHVKEHAELAWLLSCYSYMGELNRMTQFKDKAKNQENVNLALFAYPVLMAADILLYGTDLVPVGDDQKQHLELARDIAARFNNAYSDVFTIPEPYISQHGARIMSLTDPSSKMAKSDNDVNGFISLLEPESGIIKKIKRATTDSEAEVRYDPVAKPGVSNLIEIYAGCKGVSVKEAEAELCGLNYGGLKGQVAEAVCQMLSPIQAEYDRLINDWGYLNEIMQENAIKAQRIADNKIKQVKKAIGLV